MWHGLSKIETVMRHMFGDKDHPLQLKLSLKIQSQSKHGARLLINVSGYFIQISEISARYNEQYDTYLQSSEI